MSLKEIKPSRRKFTSVFKAKVALEAMEERVPIAELCKKYNLHPNLIIKWKRQIKENCATLFDNPHSGKNSQDALVERLYKTIGELTMDVEYLKKKSCHEC